MRSETSKRSEICADKIITLLTSKIPYLVSRAPLSSSFFQGRILIRADSDLEELHRICYWHKNEYNIKFTSQVIKMFADGLFERIIQMERKACKGQNASPLFFGAKTVNDGLWLLHNTLRLEYMPL